MKRKWGDDYFSKFRECLANGTDREEMLRYLQEAADQNHGEALYYLAEYTEDIDERQMLLLRSIREKFAYAMITYAREFSINQHEMLQEAFDMNDPLVLGLFFSQGLLETPRNSIYAVNALSATESLFRFHLLADEGKYLYWIREGAKQGCYICQDLLIGALVDDEWDPDEALYWIDRLQQMGPKDYGTWWKNHGSSFWDYIELRERVVLWLMIGKKWFPRDIVVFIGKIIKSDGAPN
jgi:hypothetical protein